MTRPWKSLFAAAVCLALSQGGTASAALITLNFDTRLDNGAPIPVNTLVNAAYPGVGATFSANATIVAGGPGGIPTLPNFAAGLPLFSGVITVTFDTPTDFVSAQNVTASGFTLTAFRADDSVVGVSVAPFNSTPTGGPFFTAMVTDPTASIARVTFTPVGGQYGFDNFTFNQTAVVPEPSSMVLLGLGAAGLVGYARKRRTTPAA
ncbi:MAG: hypothetical protein C0501_07790 [Isosphaera sp.]|nr:hypothetical protein [Isosphaera sp.]